MVAVSVTPHETNQRTPQWRPAQVAHHRIRNKYSGCYIEATNLELILPTAISNRYRKVLPGGGCSCNKSLHHPVLALKLSGEQRLEN